MPYFRDPYREDRVIEVTETMARILRSRHWKEIHEYQRQPSTEDGNVRQEAITDGEPDSTNSVEGTKALPEQRQSKRKASRVKRG